MSNAVCRSLKRRLNRLLMVQFLLGFFPHGLIGLHGAADTNAVQTSGPGTEELRRGEQLARQYCQSCHLFPEPGLLDKATWEKGALPFMSKWLGISKMNLDLRPGRRFVEAAGLFPASPMLPVTDWEAICKYYIASAPEQSLPQAPHPKIRMGLKQFTVVIPDYRFQVPLTTLVRIDPEAKQFYLSDAGTKTLNVLDPQGNMKFSHPVASPAVSLVFKPDRFYATLIGSVTPSDEPQGEVVEFMRSTNAFQQSRALTQNLMRPVEAVFADLNQDKKEDLVVCSFGNYLGRFSWFENRGDTSYREHILLDRPGAVRACVYDFNKDGLPDILVLMAQGREGIYLFTNQGNGEFKMTPVVEFHPAFGSSYLELVDFNHDGFIDILATNGDNGEYASSLKNYHGVRLYLNDGNNNFREAWFFPLNGAYKAMAADFNRDGNMDIAAISYFPDFENGAEESFVYLENRGGLHFDAYSIPEGREGRWLTMDVGDLDGDGYPDIVLGSFIRGPNAVPPVFSSACEKRGPSFLILKNNGSRK